jgi:diketogulonate reductase-like aldo/keto reductase
VTFCGLCCPTALQILIRWAIQRSVSVLPKSTNPERIAANLAVGDWEMAREDVETLGHMPYKVWCSLPGVMGDASVQV